MVLARMENGPNSNAIQKRKEKEKNLKILTKKF